MTSRLVVAIAIGVVVLLGLGFAAGRLVRSPAPEPVAPIVVDPGAGQAAAEREAPAQPRRERGERRRSRDDRRGGQTPRTAPAPRPAAPAPAAPPRAPAVPAPAVPGGDYDGGDDG